MMIVPAANLSETVLGAKPILVFERGFTDSLQDGPAVRRTSTARADRGFYVEVLMHYLRVTQAFRGA